MKNGIFRNFSNCINALDGKQIVMKVPANGGGIYYKCKHTFSIVLMVLVDTEYKFTYVDVGCNGRISDGGVFNNCSLAAALETNTLNITSPQPLPHRQEPVPYTIVADAAFSHRSYIMKPFPHQKLTGSEKDYRLIDFHELED